MNLKILYEDEYILALDKPSGLVVHPDGRTLEYSLTKWIEENRPEIMGVGEEERLQNGEVIQRPGIVHRLDRDTSGVIVVAKTKETHQFVKEQFQNKEIKKVYHAVVWCKFNIEDKDINSTIYNINKPIGRSASDFRKWSAEFGAKGELREAITDYKILAQSSNPPNPLYIKGGTKLKNTDNSFSYLEVYPKTGRTHQIRVHLKSISHPVVCDKLYGPKMNNESGIMNYEKEKCFGFDRLALHALSIKLKLPDGVLVEVVSPLPEEFEEAKNLLKSS